MFQFGRTRSHSPIVIIRMGQIALKETEKSNIIDAMTFLLLVVKKYMLCKGYSENITFIADVKDFGLQNYNKKVVQPIIEYFSKHFVSETGKVFIFNASLGFSLVWKAFECKLELH